MKEYTITTPSGETTVKLSDEDAKRLGATPVAGKAKTAENKAATPENKARTTSSKRAEAADKSFSKSKDNG